MKTHRASLAIIAALCCGAADAQTCNISGEKRTLVTAVLCGQNASATDYRVQGSGCVARSFKTRLLDTAKQVAVFRACGDGAFADRLRAGTLQSMSFVQALSRCSDERLDFAALYAEAEREVAARAAMLVCTPELQAVSAAQRPKAERNLEVALDPASSRLIEDRFSISVDTEGNVTERSVR